MHKYEQLVEESAPPAKVNLDKIIKDFETQLKAYNINTMSNGDLSFVINMKEDEEFDIKGDIHDICEKYGIDPEDIDTYFDPIDIDEYEVNVEFTNVQEEGIMDKITGLLTAPKQEKTSKDNSEAYGIDHLTRKQKLKWAKIIKNDPITTIPGLLPEDIEEAYYNSRSDEHFIDLLIENHENEMIEGYEEFYHNIINPVNALAEETRFGEYERVSEDEVDPEELAKGIEHELEHDVDEAEAKEIALDHLSERSDYYTQLEKCLENDDDEEVDIELEEEDINPMMAAFLPFAILALGTNIGMLLGEFAPDNSGKRHTTQLSGLNKFISKLTGSEKKLLKRIEQLAKTNKDIKDVLENGLGKNGFKPGYRHKFNKALSDEGVRKETKKLADRLSRFAREKSITEEGKGETSKKMRQRTAQKKKKTREQLKKLNMKELLSELEANDIYPEINVHDDSEIQDKLIKAYEED
jgi:hypothetical protein